MLHKDLPSNAIGVLLQLVGAKWKILIIQELLKKEMRFSELKKKLGCTSKVLISCLKEMEADDLVIREEEIINGSTKILYYLTDIGFTLRPVIQAMSAWGKDYKKLRKLMERV